jgi:hypothetical protein
VGSRDNRFFNFCIVKKIFAGISGKVPDDKVPDDIYKI